MKIFEPDASTAMLLRSDPKPSNGGAAGALREFDAYFLAQVLKGGQSDDEDRLLDGGSAGRMYRDYFFEEIARVLATRGGLGITDQLKNLMPGNTSDEAKPETGRDPEAQS